jgi:protein phosphatase
MGGQAAGEIASKLAVESVLDYFRRNSRQGKFPLVGENFDDISPEANALASAVQLASRRVFAEAATHPDRRGMGTTLVALLVSNGKASVAHVGDSRAYLLRNGQIKQLTTDHSLVMEQVRRGFMTLEEAERSSMQNIITRALGSEETAEPDVLDVEVASGDIFLLATDGLSKLVKEQRLREITRSAPTLEAACNELVAAARAAGGDDNITCLLLRIN